ncbi:protein amnionless-like [Plakobranchus ocellatus]|uniref:Protein amnionless n=1 Tax=Plakobranchus ocellatus TaxID=259542 RepID=A0AAV3ZWN2_9GAST|nr:protein amnionless-like [Plakobranchus ocellatus]
MKAILFCLCAFSFVCCEAVYKRWLLDTNFENPQNWNVKRAPCGNDVVILPDDSPVVYMQMNTTIKELVLPSTGELILGNSVSLGFTASPSSGCPDAKGDVEFTAVHPGPWMNPKDWCATSTERGTCDKSPRLEVENVPCRYDDVIFPRNRAYFVDLSELDSNTTVKSLKLIGSSLTTASFASFVNSSDGQRMFRRGKTAGPVLQISRQACDDQGGCACGNDRPEITKKICAYVNKNCARPRCSNSILPTGMCCRSCGASLKITKGYGFVLDEFKSILKKEFFNDTVSSKSDSQVG